MPKSFITKTYLNRAENEDIDANKRIAYVKEKIFKEFIGYQFYGMVCEGTPKAYISLADQTYYLNIKKVELSQSLRDYLQLSNKDVGLPQWEFEEKKLIDISKKIHQLKGIGPIVFMAKLLGDMDVFGVKLENVLVQDGKAIKIDPAEIQINIDDSNTLDNSQTRYDVFLKNVITELITNNYFLPHDQKHGGNPFFNSFSGWDKVCGRSHYCLLHRLFLILTQRLNFLVAIKVVTYFFAAFYK